MLLTVIAALGALAQTAPTILTNTHDVALVGLAATETAQLFVVNSAPAPTAGAAASCVGSLTYTNAAGAAIGAPVNFTLGTGQSAVASLPYSQAGQSGRAVVRARVTLTRAAGSAASCSLKAFFETFDTTTGATHIHIDGGPFVIGGGILGRINQ